MVRHHLSGRIREQVRFDDRLTTVLAQPAEDAHDRAVRWRQLDELLARSPGDLGSDAARQALAEIAEQSASIVERVRAAAARAVSGLKIPADLIAIFAGDTLAVAAPVLAAAMLSDEEWRTVHGRASAEVQAFIANLKPALFGGEAPPVPSEPAAPPPTEPISVGSQAIPSISDLVARIERLRRTRSPSDDGHGRPGDPAAGMFRWEALPSGEIGWVDGIPRGAVIGRSLAAGGEDGFDPRVERAFSLRAPFREAPLVLAREGPLAGEWRVSGVPAFEPADGRFAGYSGIAIRSQLARPLAAAPEPAEVPDHDSVRELVHEIKTPLNAIMGFAEIIERQYLGPADQRYRTRAGEIMGQARVLLEAIEDLDFAAKLQAAGPHSGASADLSTIAGELEEAMTAAATARGATLRFDRKTAVTCAVNHELGLRLMRRFCLALVDSAVAREAFLVRLEAGQGQCLITSDLPGALNALSDQALFAADNGAAVWLRLLRGLVRIAGGDLTVADGRLILALPQSPLV
jgi:hypothetical protein